jgi:hypothetical protein
MATNKPTGDNARKGAVKKRSQLKSSLAGQKIHQALNGIGTLRRPEEGAGKENIQRRSNGKVRWTNLQELTAYLLLDSEAIQPVARAALFLTGCPL